MDKRQYGQLGTSPKRPENKSDHKILAQMMRNEWNKTRDFYKQPYEEIKLWQLKRLKEIVKHAYETVPLYKKKYSAVGFHPNDFKTWNDFAKLPILSKEELITGFPALTVSSKHTLEFTTRSSGSSGQFVTLAVSPEAVYRDTIQGARQFLFQSGERYDSSDVALFIYTSPWWISSIDGDYKTEFLPTTTRIEEVVQAIRIIKPIVLSLYPTYLLKFYEKGIRLKDLGVKLIIVHSEQSGLQERLELTEFFGVPVLDEFSSEELTRIALECPYRNYHLEEDACYIEIVNPKTNENLKEDSRGLVVGTNLLNEATPIIRYSQGDIATIVKDKKCDCASNFRILDSIFGRQMDSIISNSGETIPASCFMDIAYNWYLELGIPIHGLRYQLVQDKKGIITIYLVVGRYQLSVSEKKIMHESLYQLIPRDMKVNIKTVDKLPFDTGIKFRPILSLKKQS